MAVKEDEEEKYVILIIILPPYIENYVCGNEFNEIIIYNFVNFFIYDRRARADKSMDVNRSGVLPV